MFVLNFGRWISGVVNLSNLKSYNDEQLVDTPLNIV
jgi:hypothetical protein